MKEREDVRDGEGSGSQKVREEPRNSWLDQGGPRRGDRSENWTKNPGYEKGQRREGE